MATAKKKVKKEAYHSKSETRRHELSEKSEVDSMEDKMGKKKKKKSK